MLCIVTYKPKNINRDFTYIYLPVQSVFLEEQV